MSAVPIAWSLVVTSGLLAALCARDALALRASRRELEGARRQSAIAAGLVSSVSSIVIVLDRDERVTGWNETAAATFALGEPRVRGLPIGECPIAWTGDGLAEVLRRHRSGEASAQGTELAFRGALGDERSLGVTLHALDGARGDRLGWLVLGRDITEKKLREASLEHSRRMESIGQLAAGIAHEINTPNQYVTDNLSFLRESFATLDPLLRALQRAAEPGGTGANGVEDAAGAARLAEILERARDAGLGFLVEEIPVAIDESLDGLAQVAEIVGAMRVFSHPGSTGTEAVDVNATIESTLWVARNEWRYVAEVETELDPELPTVQCHRREIGQAVLNLVVNAAHAIAEVVDADAGERGTIRVATRVEGGDALIEVADTGCGMTEEVRARAFDRFFTTKEVGRGTGQGLAIAHAIVEERHGGSIEVESAPGEGTLFSIRLPLRRARESEEAAVA